MAKRKLGIFIIGAYGGVATTMIVGARAFARKLIQPFGLITETPEFANLKLAAIDDLVFGGMDIRRSSLIASAKEVASETGTISPDILKKLRLL